MTRPLPRRRRGDGSRSFPRQSAARSVGPADPAAGPSEGTRVPPHLPSRALTAARGLQGAAEDEVEAQARRLMAQVGHGPPAGAPRGT